MDGKGCNSSGSWFCHQCLNGVLQSASKTGKGPWVAEGRTQRLSGPGEFKMFLPKVFLDTFFKHRNLLSRKFSARMEELRKEGKVMK